MWLWGEPVLLANTKPCFHFWKNPSYALQPVVVISEWLTGNDTLLAGCVDLSTHLEMMEIAVAAAK